MTHLLNRSHSVKLTKLPALSSEENPNSELAKVTRERNRLRDQLNKVHSLSINAPETLQMGVSIPYLLKESAIPHQHFQH